MIGDDKMKCVLVLSSDSLIPVQVLTIIPGDMETGRLILRCLISSGIVGRWIGGRADQELLQTGSPVSLIVGQNSVFDFKALGENLMTNGVYPTAVFRETNLGICATALFMATNPGLLTVDLGTMEYEMSATIAMLHTDISGCRLQSTKQR